MKRKVIALSVAVFALLAGCSSNLDHSTEPITPSAEATGTPPALGTNGEDVEAEGGATSIERKKPPVASTTIKGEATPNMQVVDTTNLEYDDYVVRLPRSSTLCAVQMHIAAHNGYFDEVGLKYEFVSTGDSAVIDLLAADKIDATISMFPNTGLFLDRGLDIKVVGGSHTGCLQFIVPVDSDITTVEELKGKKIGVPGMGSTSRIFASRVFLRYGIGATEENMEIEYLAFTGPELSMALENGLVDAVATNDPNGANIVAGGVGKTLLSNATHEYYKDEYCCATIMSPSLINNHPVAAERFLLALQKAGDFVDANPHEAARIQIENEYVPGEVEVFGNAHASYSYTTSVEGGIGSLRNNLEDLKAIGMISDELNIDATIDRAFVIFQNPDLY